MEAAKLSGIRVSSYLTAQANAGKVFGWEKDGFEMPRVPFSAGTGVIRGACLSPRDAREMLLSPRKRDNRAGRILDTIAVYNVRPRAAVPTNLVAWDIIGDTVGFKNAALFLRYGEDNKLTLYSHHSDSGGSAVLFFRTLIFNREIRTLD
ncbi:hypothetical protein KKE78_02835 [Patescibacteria group bacterium]|nr:hypothetical protein [Patescibacteria group bacterium]